MIWRCTETGRLLLALVLAASIAGCAADEPPTAPETTPAESVNEDKPNANARITSQVVFGTPGKHTSVSYMRCAADASHCFRGIHDSWSGVGELNAGGSMRWFQRIAYSARDVCPLPASSIVSMGILVVGAHDTDGLPGSDVGYASLYSASGTLLSQVLVTSIDYAVWLNAIVPVTDSTFVACGGIRRSGVGHPYLALVHVKGPGVLELGGALTLDSYSELFDDLVTLPSSPSELALAVSCLDGSARRLHGLRAPWPGFGSVTVEWSREIPATTGPMVDVRDIEQADGNIYLAGSVDDNRKPPISSGGFWSSGLVASWTATGEPRWLTLVSATKHAESFNALAIGSDALYAVGHGGVYKHSNAPNEEFGNGLISKLDPGTGEVIANFTIGSERHHAELNAATWTTGGLVCGGRTELDLHGGPYRGWLCTVNVSGTGVPARRPATAAAPAAETDRPAVASPVGGRAREVR